VKPIELYLDEQTYEQAQKVAQARFSTLEALLTELIQHLALIESQVDPLLGMFAAEPELLDQVVETALAARESQPLRQADG
jgi:hypothetical protein